MGRLAIFLDENQRLREQNQHLLKRLQSFALLEAENMWLKCLPVDLRGRIDGEIGHFPYAKNANQVNMGGVGHATSSRGLRCDEQVYCTLLGMGMQGQGANGLSGPCTAIAGRIKDETVEAPECTTSLQERPS